MNKEIEQIIKRQKAEGNAAEQKANTTLERINSLEDFADNTSQYLSELNRTFEEKTALNSNEISILFTCVGLQIIRQHYLTKFVTRENDQMKMIYNFNSKEDSIILVKDYNRHINLIIETIKLKKNDNNLEIEFKIDNEKFTYRIEELK